MDENTADICGQKIPRPSELWCAEFWGSQFSPEACLLPFRKPPCLVWPGFGRNGWAVGRLGADATLCLWAWGKVGRGQPQNSEVMWGLSKRCDFPSCAWPRAGSLPQDLLLKLAVFPHAVCPAYVISSCLRKGPESQFKKKKTTRFGEVPFKLLFYGKSREKTFFLK